MTLGIVLTVLMLLLQALDVYTTQRALAAGGSELNPIARAVFKLVGSPLIASVLMKVVITGFMIAVMWYIYPAYWYLFGGYTFVLAAIVANNYTQR